MFCEVRVTKPAQAPNKAKQNKPLDAPNLHRHQQKPKKIIFPGTMGPLLSSCWKCCFFFGACRCLVHLVVCFFCFCWCLSMFGASSGLFFFGCLSMFCEVRIPKPAHAKKTLDAPNLHRHPKKTGYMGPLLNSCDFFCDPFIRASMHHWITQLQVQ